MRNSYICVTIFILIFFLSGCKENPVPLTGDILGYARLINEAGYHMNDHENIYLAIRNDALVLNTLSDESGQFIFKGLSAGRYSIVLEKEGYYAEPPYQFDHLGGFSPTILEFELHEIPGYEIILDSAEYIVGEYEIPRLFAYGKLNGTEGKPKIYYPLQCFFGVSQSISLENHHAHCSAYIYRNDMAENIAFRIPLKNIDLSGTGADTIYLLVHPAAVDFNYDLPAEEALGKASNVVSFTIEN